MARSLAESFAARFGRTGGRLGVQAATLVKVTSGTRAPDAQSAGTNPTSTSHACKAFVGSFTSTELDSTLVKSEDRTISIFGASIADDKTPEPNDKITFDGVTYRIVGGKDGLGVRRDPASVLYLCHVRR